MCKVSVVMNCLNGEQFLKEAIDSVFAQSFEDWEIIFWDNASNDRTAAIAQSYGDRVKYYRADSTEDLGIARNLVFSKASGEFIAMLDADDVWLPNKLERQLPLFENNSVGMTFSNSMFFDGNGDVGEAFSQSEPHRGDVFGQLLSRNFISTETMMFRRSDLERLPQPWFQKDFLISMDYDLTLRMALISQVDYVDDVLSRWRIHANSWSMKKRGLAYVENEAMLSRLIVDFPDISKSFTNEIRIFQKSNDLRLGIYSWAAGDVGKSRQIFKRNRCHGAIFWMLLVATYLYPFSWSQEKLMKLWALWIKCRRG